MKIVWDKISVALFKDLVSDTKKLTESETKKIIKEVAQGVERKAKSYTPVRSGRLRAGWKLRKQRQLYN